MRKSTAGFTIIEIVVTIIVIGILAGAAFFSYTQVQKDARNSQRNSKVNILVEALEKYYAKNGEYPSCSALTQSTAQVVTNVLPGLDPEALATPGSPGGTNSITCTPLSAGSGPDAYAYIGDGSATCSSGNACLQYTLQYRNENTGAIVAVESRHKTQIAATTGVTITATTISDAQINLSWTASNNATSYQLQRADDANITVNVVSSSPSTTTASAIGLTSGKTYYFRVAPVGSTGQGTWSNTANATTTIAAPAAPSVSSSLAGSTITVSIPSAVSCGSGTVEYQLLSANSATLTMPAFTILSNWSGATSAQIANAIQGHKYDFQSKARCKGPNATSTESTSTTASRTISFSAPPAPTYLSPSFFDSPNAAVVNYQSYCPTGTTAINRTFRSRAWTGGTWTNPWGFNDSWTNNTGSNKNVEYWGKYQCRSDQAGDSPVSPESYNVIVVTP